MTPETALAMYRRQMAKWGSLVTVRRMVANAAPLDVINVRVRVTGYRPEELVGGIDQGHRKAIVLAEDVAALDPPLRSGDRIVMRGVTLHINAVDDSTRRIGDTLLAYQCDVSGSR